MAHIPHIYIAPPWPGGAGPGVLRLESGTRHHLERVLRRSDGDVTYTDGVGTVGTGRLVDGAVHRGRERTGPVPVPRLRIAVSPLHRSERNRFLVEKLAELGVSRLQWVRSAHTVGRPPAPAKTQAWAVSALEQSRGAHLLEVSGTMVALADVASEAVIFVEVGGDALDVDAAIVRGGAQMDEVTLIVGPEGGFADDEVPDSALRLGLGDRILRTETAAIVAAGLLLDAGRRRR